MVPFEVMYGKKCKTLVNWDGSVNKLVLGIKLLQEME